MRARVRHRQERFDEAMADLSEHLRLHPADPMAYLFRSAIYKEQNNLAAALADLNLAHQADPEDPQVCNSLAWMLSTCSQARFRDGDRAVKLARQACGATEYQHPVCLGTLAAGLAETGDFQEAIRWQNEALSVDPSDEEGRARLELYEAGAPYRE
jgi:tetratricopeptide (TPR) repeat protein